MTSSVAVCIPTRDRPVELGRALDSVHLQDTRVRVVVADNARTRSAAALCREHPAAPVYVHEPRPGVAHVRNLLLETAEKIEADVVLFLDDDMMLQPGAVSAFLEAGRRYPDSVLTGPVTYDVEGPTPPRWTPISRGHHEDGDQLRVTGTGNTWIPLDVWRRGGRPLFDPEFGLTGGEDTDFFHRLTSRGMQLRWCSRAEAIEVVPHDRATSSSLARRYERAGYVNGRLALRSRPGPVVFAQGMLRVVLGLALTPVPRALRPQVSNPHATYHSGLGHMRAALNRPRQHYGKDFQ